MKVIGYRRNDFSTKDGKHITGCRVYLSTDIAPEDGQGISVRDLYLSDAKMASLGINLNDLMNHEVRVFYNEFRKLEAIMPAD